MTRRPLARRYAFTLIEVLLVLTLLVVIAGLAMPSLSAGMGRSRMNQAAEEVRTAWAKARLDAASSGQTLRFQCWIGSNRWQLASADASQEQVDAALAAQRKEDTEQENELSGVVFRQLLVANLPGDLAMGESVADGELSPAVLFRPDGSSSDAEALLEDEAGRRMKVTLRGLTGAASVDDALEDGRG
ncbi:MAG: prepilin-type N-terminal cleavage/methylation domain-containing protein [Planctomycetota bacterium]